MWRRMSHFGKDQPVIQHYLAARAELEGPGSPFHVSTEEVRGVTLRSYAAAPPTIDRKSTRLNSSH